MIDNIIKTIIIEEDPEDEAQLAKSQPETKVKPVPVPAPIIEPPTGPVEVVDVRFKVGGKVYYFSPGKLTVQAGQNVIIETARGVEYAECTNGNHMTDYSKVVAPLRPVLRIATDADSETLLANQKKEKKAFEVCQQKILELKLDMKLIEVEYSFDGSKILFFFTSDGRVDFRELVKNLASVFRTRIELRQIGVRDEAKMLGGLGICGRPFCCSQFLDDFHPVSIKMAKTQNLSLNPTKISGTCGRLMCCLKYEQEAYEDMQKRTPKLESYVETPLGKGVVTEVSLLKASVKVTLDNEPDTSHVYKINEITVLHNGSRLKKSAPLLPPDPPIVDEYDEPEVVTEYPEIVYNAPETVKTVFSVADPVAEIEKKSDSKTGNRRRNNRSRSKKKPAQTDKAEAKPTEQKKPLLPKTEPKVEAKPAVKPAAEQTVKPKSNKNRYYRNKRRKPSDGGNKPNQGNS